MTPPPNRARSGRAIRSRPIGDLPDPAAVEGDDETRRRAFDETFRLLHERLAPFTQLSDAALDQLLAHTSTK